MEPWKIRIDTGGTFTDCWALAPGDPEPKQVKVLSSGRLKVPVESVSDDGLSAVLSPPASWNLPDALFAGFNVEIPAGGSSLIVNWDKKSRRLTAETPLFRTGLTQLDLWTGEEAPVIGARLLTGTGLDKPFPPIRLRLATTRGTNALLEQKGAPTALFVTGGFGDLLVIRDQKRPDLFALEHHKNPLLYRHAVEVTGRLSATGEVLTPLDLEAPGFLNQCQDLLDSGVRVAAVALLHSYRNPDHEEKLLAFLLNLGFEHVSLSSRLAPLIRILPRAETAVVDAYLAPVMQSFIDSVGQSLGEQAELLTMTSAGGLEVTHSFRPKDSLFSGPAGGVVGAAAAGRALGFDKLITFDMGGTSTDVARYDGDFQYQFEQKAGPATLLSPSLKIGTVASGGGSICQWTPAGLRVGPESAGANPGPACYGRGGPLTITDVNLLLGRIDPENFGIPISAENHDAAQTRALELQREAGVEAGDGEPDPAFLQGLIDISVEQMADAIRTISIREGASPHEYALLAFGGAGPLHACDIAERLGMDTIIVPPEAGLLSAYGLHNAVIERFAQRQVLQALDEVGPDIPTILSELADGALQSLKSEAPGSGDLQIRRRIAELRLAGQDAPLTLEVGDPGRLADDFRKNYADVFGYRPPGDRPIELVSLRVIASTRPPDIVSESRAELHEHERSTSGKPDSRAPLPFFDRSQLEDGKLIDGPAVIQDPFSTLFLKPGWTAEKASRGSLLLSFSGRSAEIAASARDLTIERELFRHRFENIAAEMGAMLQRSAVSTNVKERLDFSCALLDLNGDLVVNAPHIPVHLGALGLCVREVMKAIDLRPGDMVITNHPAYGGSHLPDVTVISAVFDDNGDRVGFVANRAHHAEIGGISPGSMPPAAKHLEEEGVVIAPRYLFEKGESRFDAISGLLASAPYPTRGLKDNLADLNAQAAANRRGAAALERLTKAHGTETVRDHLETLATQSQKALRLTLEKTGFTGGEAVEKLDDGCEIRIAASLSDSGRLVFDFTGTSESHPGNLSATPAIVRSALLYVVRLWTQSELPLNEGLLREVDVILPRCFLNPEFPAKASECPAVVGGNVETSQRLVDTLIKLLGFQACSQGTMNNFIFGSDRFGYYETIAGGAGAGPGYDGASALHTHMTNTAITDPEILEHRYPVRLHRFAVRAGSGGAGRWHGGDGVIREFEMLEPLSVSLLTQHRKETPFGLNGGNPGAPGRQSLLSSSSPHPKPLDGITALNTLPGDRILIETPGGGGCGAPR